MSARKAKQEIVDRFYIGVVEDNIDPKRKGRTKVRIERLHGKADGNNTIPTDDLPWAMPYIDSTGGAFSVPAINKVVYVTHIEGDFYSPEYFNAEHYNINLQEKLQSFNDDGYENFYAISYDDKHQYYHEKGKGVVFDYVKSNFNMKENGDMQMNLRDNNAKLFLGTEDASQQAVLGNHWMNWMDELVQNLLGAKGGPYLGNLGAPIIPNPGMIEVLNKYLAIRETFLSDHVYIVDDFRVKEQTRQFDKEQQDDNYNNELLQPTNNTPTRGYQPIERAPGSEGAVVEPSGNETLSEGKEGVVIANSVQYPESTSITNTLGDDGLGGDNGISKNIDGGEIKKKVKGDGKIGNVAAGLVGGAVIATGFVKGMPPNTFGDYLGSSKLPLNPTQDEKKRILKPFNNPTFGNGTIPTEKMTASKYLKSTFSEENDERKYLLDEASVALDKWLDQYHLERDANMPKILAIKGYQNIDRQTNIRKQFPSLAPKPGTDPFGFANQIELWLSIDKKDINLVNNIKKYLTSGVLRPNPTPQERSLDRLLKIGRTYKWVLTGRTSDGDLQWWHWIYDSSIISTTIIDTQSELVSNNVIDEKENEKLTKDGLSIKRKKGALRKNRNLSIVEKIKNKDIVAEKQVKKKEFETFAIRFNLSNTNNKQGFNEEIKYQEKKYTIKNFLIEYFQDLEIDFQLDESDNLKNFKIKNIQEKNKYTEDYLIKGIEDRMTKIKLEFKKFKSKKDTHFYNISKI